MKDLEILKQNFDRKEKFNMANIMGIGPANIHRYSFKGNNAIQAPINFKQNPPQESEKFKNEKKEIYTYAYTIATLITVGALLIAVISRNNSHLEKLTNKIDFIEEALKRIPGGKEALEAVRKEHP